MVEFFAYTVNAALIALGTIVTVNPGWAEQKKRLVGGWLVVLGFISLALTSVQNSRESAELKEALANQSKLVTSNLELQRENLALSKENRELSTKTLRAALGDPDKPPYLYFDFGRPEKPLHSQLYIHNSSAEHAAHSVTASTKLDADVVATSGGVSVPPGNRVPAQFPNKAGIPSNVLRVPQLETIGKRVVIVSIIASSAGSYQQVTGLVRSSETKFLQAVRISRLDDKLNVIFSRQDSEFPPDFAWPKQRSVSDQAQ